MPAPYPLEFRREAVELLKRSGKSVPVLASELGVSPQSLRNWARQIDIDAGRLLKKQMDIDQAVFGVSGADSHMQYLARFTEEPLKEGEQTAKRETTGAK